MKRELIDKSMSLAVTKNAILPYVTYLGARHLVDHPYLGQYDHENKTMTWGLGHKKHGDKRHRTSVKYEAVHYADGEQIEGETTSIQIERRLGWSRRIDNRKVATKVTVTQKIMLYEETFNKLRTFSSLDIMNQFTASAQGEIAGIGGSVSQTSSITAHTEVETEKMNHKKTERVIDDTSELDYPGPILYDADIYGDAGALLHRKGSIQYEGDIWLIERPVMKLQTTTPMTQWGIWDCARLHLNLYDWAGNYGALPKGEAQEPVSAERSRRTARPHEGQSRSPVSLVCPWQTQSRKSRKQLHGLRMRTIVASVRSNGIVSDSTKM